MPRERLSDDEPKQSREEEAYERLRGDLAINREVLDEELISQPHSYFHVGENHARAVSRRDALKQELELEEARLDEEIRENAAAESEKINNDQVKARIHADQSYQRASSKYLRARLRADEWEALKKAWEQRSYVLKDLVGLHIAGYFGEVTGARERSEARERVQYNRDRRSRD